MSSPPVKDYYVNDLSDASDVSSVRFTLDDGSAYGCYVGPANDEVYDSMVMPFYDCVVNRAITPESKNSSNDSLITSNTDMKDYSPLGSINEEQTLDFKCDFGGDDPNINPIVITNKTNQSLGLNIINSDRNESNEESAYRALGQLIIPFIIAGLGNVGAGVVLDNVQHWRVFTQIPQLIILVPALLGLKGNVEMTLASRLSTHANMGHMDVTKELKKMVIGNMALVQCQASVVGFIAPLVAIALSFITNKAEHHKQIELADVVLVTASAVITANIANLLLGTLMCFVVIFSRKFNINPDNIATPIAASVGDFVSMLLLAYISQGLYDGLRWLPLVFLILFTILTPIWAIIARRNKYTKKVLYNGWLPIIGAMLLQNTGGLIMENGLSRFESIAAFQPVINGVGGSLSVVQSSRISTYLHKNQKNEVSLIDTQLTCSPFKVFFGKNPHALMARLLLLIAAPSHLIFLLALRLIKAHFQFTFLFVLFYIVAALIQITILLTVCYFIVILMWRRRIDPDNSSAPFLTAFADLLGSGLLFLSFLTLYYFNDPNAYYTVP